MNNRLIKAGLCEGRHDLPCEEYIFPQIVEDPMDFDVLERIMRNFIHAHDLQYGNGELVVYLTGLTSCTTALIKTCYECSVILAVMHFDNKSKTYKQQEIFKRKKTKKEKELQKHIHGEYKHVRLTDGEFNRLIADYGAMAIEDKIKELDEYLEMRADKHYSSHNAVIRKWLRCEGVVKLSERSDIADIPSSPSFDIDLIMQHALHSVPTVQVRSDK